MAGVWGTGGGGGGGNAGGGVGGGNEQGGGNGGGVPTAAFSAALPGERGMVDGRPCQDLRGTPRTHSRHTRAHTPASYGVQHSNSARLDA